MMISKFVQICTQLANQFCDVGARHGFTPILQPRAFESVVIDSLDGNDENDDFTEADSDDAEENFD